jgi:lambda family phage tail tape measure protein
MASNNIARLGVVLGIDTAEFTAAIDRARAITRQMGAEMKRDMDAAAKEIVRLDHATSDYGKTLTQVQLVEREMHSGRYKSIDLTTTMRDRLLAAAAAYDAEAAAATKAAAAAAEADAKKKSIKDATDQGLRELQSMKYAMEDYGKSATKVTQMERAFATGHLQAASPEVKKELLAHAAAMDKLAGSTKVAATAQTGLTNTQKLNINYQLTDFVTQVASGQSVMIAALQQGGQLKDTFGGVGGALKALGQFFTPAIVGFGSLAAVIGTVAYAAYSGHEEFNALKDSIALTGNYAKVSVDDFYRMSAAISSTSRASIGEAKDVMSAMISSGQFTKQSFDSVTKTIITFSQLTGLSAKDAADKLIPSLDGTAQSALRLNNQYNFLTVAQYKHIEALNAQYKQQDAIVLTSELLAQSWKKHQRELGYLGAAYEATTKLVKNFWDAITGFGKEETADEKVARLTKSIVDTQKYLSAKATNPVLQGQTSTSDIARRKEQLLKDAVELSSVNNQIALDAKEQGEKDLTNKYAAEKSTRQQKAGELAKAEIKERYDLLRVGKSEEARLVLEFDQKRDEAIADNNKKNIQEEGKYKLENMTYLQKQLTAIELERYNKTEELNLKKELFAKGKQDASKEELQKAFDEITANEKLTYEYTHQAELKDKMSGKEISRAQELFMIENSGRSIRTEDLALEKEKFEIRNRGADKLEEIQKNREKYTSATAIEEAQNRAKAITAIEIQAAEDRNARLKELRAGSFGQGIGRAADDYLTNMATAMEQGRQAFDSVISNMGTALDNFVKTGKLSFKDLAGSIIRDLIAIQLKASATGLFSMLVKTMFSVATGGTSTVADAAIGAMGAPKAAGGPVSAGVTHMVGENGPELFTPSGSGTIIPNHALGGAGGTTNVTNNYINAIDTKSFEQRLLGSANAIWAANTYANKSLAVGRGRS